MEGGSEHRTLEGLKVLVVEDDYFVATDCANQLRVNGATVLGPVADTSTARHVLADTQPDCVVLDVNLKGEMVFELAQELMDREVPTIFTTGYDATVLPARLQRVTCLLKPVETHELINAVRHQTLSRKSSRD